MELYASAERLATNQKAAGSSPAERTTNYLQMLRFCFVESTRRSARTTHLTTYLFRNALFAIFRPPAIAWQGSSET